MRFVFVLEDDPKFMREIAQALALIDPKLQIRQFKTLKSFSEWIKQFIEHGPRVISVAGEVPAGVFALQVPEEEELVLQLLVSKVEFLGVRQLGLLKRTRDLFIRLNRIVLAISAVLVFAALSGSVTFAQTAASAQTDRIAALEKQAGESAKAIATAQTAADNGWMLVSAALVLMMSGPGLALFYGGLVRKKNILGTMMQTFAMMAVITVLWAFVTYSLAFSDGNAFIGGLHNAFLRGVGLAPNPTYAATIPAQTFMVFQLMFAIITPALITGAFAERMKFSAMLAFMVLWAIVVYSPMAHMVWGKGGLLNATLGGRLPCLDFAGGTVVHITSGVSALVTALYLGKRLGYPRIPMPPHSVVLSFIGACMLWVGWFGFNAGSALGAGPLATSAFVATHFAAAAAAVGWGAAEWFRQGKVSALGAISGAVAGLVGITPAAGFVTPMSALWIGLIVGICCYLMVVKVKAAFGYDDSLDAFGIHGAGGTIGAILTGFFANSAIYPIFGAGKPTGLFEGNWRQVFDQLAGVAIAWSVSIVGTLIILFVVDRLIGLRVNDSEEHEGLDLSQHGEEGYDWAH